MERPDFSAVTKILTSGTWFDIKKGSLQSGAGIEHVSIRDVEPLYRFTLPDGVEGVILARCLDGWAPLVTNEQAQRAASMQEFDEPLRVPGTDGREILNPFAHVRGTRDVTPAGINRP
jgi:hypothetical protein